MEAGHPLGQQQAVALEADVDLVAADGQERGVGDFAPDAHPALGLEVGQDVGQHLALAHFDLGRGSIVGLEMGQDPRRLQRLAVHLPRAGTVRQGDQPVVRVRGVVQERRPARDVAQQDARRDDHKVRLAEGQVAVVVQRAQGQAGGGLGHWHDRGHTAVDGQRPAVRLLHNGPEDLVQQHGIDDELGIGLQRRAGRFQVRLGPLFRQSHGGRIRPSGFDHLAQFRIRDVLDVQLETLLGQVRRFGLRPAASAANRNDPAVQRVLQTAQRPQTPEHFVLAVHDHVLLVKVLGDPLIRVPAELDRADDLVPQRHRSRLVADKVDDVFALVAELLEDLRRPAGCVQQDRIRAGQVARARQLVGIADGRHGQELEGKVGGRLQLGQFFLDPGHLGLGILLGLDSAPGPPAGLGSPLRRRIGQDRLDDQRLASGRSRQLVLGAGDFAPRHPGERHAAQGGTAHPSQETPPRDAVAVRRGIAAGTAVSAELRAVIVLGHRNSLLDEANGLAFGTVGDSGAPESPV